MGGIRIKIGGPIKALRLPPAEGAAIPRAIFARPTIPLAVLALWHYAFRHPEWIPHIITVYVTIITDWHSTPGADSAAYLQDLALDHPERFTAEETA